LKRIGERRLVQHRLQLQDEWRRDHRLQRRRRRGDRLENTVVKKLVDSLLASVNFRLGMSTKDKNDDIIYDKATDAL
jgi:hypothetical protein